MQPAPVPENEALRLAALDAYDLLDTPAEERFDRLVRLAAFVAHSPIAMVSLVAAQRQWFKSRVGLTLDQTERAWSFCAHAILQPDPLVVTDAGRDVRFRDNPMVTGYPYIRFYAGIPLRLADGLIVGTLCVIDTVARQLGDVELAHLSDLANAVEAELQLDPLSLGRQGEYDLLMHGKRQSRLDPLTGCWNRAGFQALLLHETAVACAQGTAFFLLLLRLHDYPRLVELEGAEAMDLALMQLASRLRLVLHGQGAVARLSEDGFALVVPVPISTPMELLAARRQIRAAIGGQPFYVNGRPIAIEISTGAACVSQPGFDVSLALVEADRQVNWALGTPSRR